MESRIYISPTAFVFIQILVYFSKVPIDGICFKTKRYLTAVALSRVILPDLKLQLIGSIGGSHGEDIIVREAILSFSKVTFKFWTPPCIQISR